MPSKPWTDQPVVPGLARLRSAWMPRFSLITRRFLLVCLAAGAQASETPPIHVPGDYDNVQDALNAAVDGQKVLVAPGTYAGPIDFLGKDVRLSSSDPRDPEIVAATQIDGGGQGSTVLFSPADSILATGRLLGLTVIGGLAPEGGGVRIDGAAPTLWNCVIRDNAATPNEGRGGGVACVNGASPLISDCQLLGNRALGTGRGGAAYWDSLSTPIFAGCDLLRNRSAYGGAVYGLGPESDTLSAWFDACRLGANIADIDGGGIYLRDSSPRFSHCVVDSNEAHAGGGVFVLGESAAQFDTTTIAHNTATTTYGGGAYLLFADVLNTTWRGCQFTQNQAQSRGGAIYALTASPELQRCVFTANSLNAEWSIEGGAIFCTDSKISLLGCTFDGNTALGPFGGSGGALYSHGAEPSLRNCILVNNSSRTAGGAITFSRTGEQGKREVPLVRHCTIFGNSTDNLDGGAIALIGGARPIIENSILWGNEPTSIDTLQGLPEVIYTCVQRGWEGEGNTKVYPGFLNLPDYPLLLTPPSNCIDGGGGADLDSIDWSKIDSNYARFNSASVDMGHYGGPKGLIWLVPADSSDVRMVRRVRRYAPGR